MRESVEEAVHHAVVAVAAAAVVALAVALFLLWRKKRVARAGGGAGGGDGDGGAVAVAVAPLPVVPLADVERATDGFHPSRMIGQGRHFTVYAAAPGLAAKRMRPYLVLGEPGGRRFPAALRSLAVPPHPNLAGIVGLSEGPGERVLIVERASAGSVSLDALLYHGTEAPAHDTPQLSWPERAAVAAGAARGLAHLHAHGVAHGRVRPRNVLVDAAAAAHGPYGVRVSDYGLSTFLHNDDGDDHGRLDARAENDVYMFGAVLLQLLTGRQWDGGRLAHWALPLIRAGPPALAEVLDERTGKPTHKAESRLLARTARVALACVANDGRSRPRMAEVSAILDDVEEAYRRRDRLPEHEVDGGEERFSGCLLAPSRSAHRSEMLLRLPV
uniref:Protein kinase domain-containing protein n=1 Tax=Oryza punctata TaxID=4537 RepID=A0A0E0LUF3_ORYPU